MLERFEEEEWSMEDEVLADFESALAPTDKKNSLEKYFLDFQFIYILSIIYGDSTS